MVKYKLVKVTVCVLLHVLLSSFVWKPSSPINIREKLIWLVCIVCVYVEVFAGLKGPVKVREVRMLAKLGLVLSAALGGT